LKAAGPPAGPESLESRANQCAFPSAICASVRGSGVTGISRVCLPVHRRRVTAVSVEVCFCEFGAVCAYISRNQIDRYGGYRSQVSIYIYICIYTSPSSCKYAVQRYRFVGRKIARVWRRFSVACAKQDRVFVIGRLRLSSFFFSLLSSSFSHHACSIAFELS